MFDFKAVGRGDKVGRPWRRFEARKGGDVYDFMRLEFNFKNV